MCERVQAALLEYPPLRSILRESLIRYGEDGELSYQGCADEDALSLTFIPVNEGSGELTFDRENGKGTCQDSYRLLMRFKFDKAERSRILDEGARPGLMTLVRRVKNALWLKFWLELGEEPQSVTSRFVSINYTRATPMVQVDITVEMSEEVEVGHRRDEQGRE